jgi:hypothetical protein
MSWNGGKPILRCLKAQRIYLIKARKRLRKSCKRILLLQVHRYIGFVNSVVLSLYISDLVVPQRNTVNDARFIFERGQWLLSKGFANIRKRFLEVKENFLFLIFANRPFSLSHFSGPLASH